MGQVLAGVQFRLHFNPDALTLVGAVFPPGALGLHNMVGDGVVAVVVSQATALPDPVCELQFQVSLSSDLIITDAIGSTLEATDIVLQPLPGEVIALTEGGNMQVEFTWTDPNPDTVSVSLAFASSPDGEFEPVAEVPGTLRAHTMEVATGQGTIYARVRPRNAVGLGPPSNVVSCPTNLPQALTLAVEIV